ncbi:MAG: hypothetical protein QXU75_08330 [Candidatus Methanomethylicaceae archaeon]
MALTSLTRLTSSEKEGSLEKRLQELKRRKRCRSLNQVILKLLQGD